MTLAEAKSQLVQRLSEIYPDREPALIAGMVMEKLTGLSRVEWLLQKQHHISAVQSGLLQQWTEELLAFRPVQYVLGEAWFMGMPFTVREGVLIPRPETEELVQWICETFRGHGGKMSVLDIGSGSGCIAISLDKKMENADITGFDVSDVALEIAAASNRQLQGKVFFRKKNILESSSDDYAAYWDVIVSNPPYIRHTERRDMEPNVLEYEPGIALFVEDNDPLLFYRKIAELGTHWLKSGGYLFFEINEAFGKETVSLLSGVGYRQVEIKQDLQGKDRMVKALWLVN